MQAAVLTALVLQITIYDNSGGQWRRYEKALGEVSRIFRAAGVQVQFREGDPNAEEKRLITYPILPKRGAESAAACRARADIALELAATAPPGVRPRLLGMAIPFADRGLNARVFLDRIEEFAESARLPPDVVAANAIAHEIGHVLVRSSGHAQSGLMAGPWGEHEVRRMGSSLLLFSKREAETMRRSISRDGCPAPAILAGN
jgi:hypothetical protein